MESRDIYNELFGKNFFNIDIDPSLDLNIVKDVCILLLLIYIYFLPY